MTNTMHSAVLRVETGHSPFFMDPVSTLMDQILLRLNRRDAPYALLRQDRSTDLRSDVDIGLLAHPIDTIDPILRELEREERLIFVHRLHYEIPHGYYYILALPGRPRHFLHLDCLFDPLGINRYYLSTAYLLNGRTLRQGVPCIAPEKEALHLLIKRIIKGRCPQAESETLQAMFCSSNPLRAEVQQWFGARGTADVAALLDRHSEAVQSELMGRLRDILRRRYLVRHLGLFLRGSLRHLLRVMQRLRQPTGYFVVIVGPDGSGKSTIAAALGEQLERAFRHVWRFHWRPHQLPRLSAQPAAPDPGADRPPDVSRYNVIVSLARFVYYWFDFVMGYWSQVYWRTAHTTLVIGERYYHDVIVNPQRYGFAVPPWLLRLASYCVPAPDLTVLLENRPEVIHERKPELSPEAIAHQIEAFRRELPFWGPSLIVATTGDAEAAAHTIGSTILRQCGRKIST
jgi:thymidylate kinase